MKELIKDLGETPLVTINPISEFDFYINFVTKIYHPNIDEQGCICLDVFMKLWTPAMQFKKTLLSVYLLL
jgi:hypothetical protein